jgi:hypothetical protein
MSYSDLDAAAFYQAAFTDDNDNNDTIESPRLPLLKKSPRARGLDLKMSQQPLMIQVRPLDLKRKGASGGGYQRISMKPSEFAARKNIVHWFILMLGSETRTRRYPIRLNLRFSFH